MRYAEDIGIKTPLVKRNYQFGIVLDLTGPFFSQFSPNFPQEKLTAATKGKLENRRLYGINT